MNYKQLVYTRIISQNARKVIIKRGIKATEYFSYCKEVGCDIWERLSKMDSLSGEPICLWLPKKYIKPNTSTYVQGVEVSLNYNKEIPEGFDIIELPDLEYLMLQGKPFEEKDFEKAIMIVKNAAEKYDIEKDGYEFDDEAPRIQLEPIPDRGYIELIGIKKIK